MPVKTSLPDLISKIKQRPELLLFPLLVLVVVVFLLYVVVVGQEPTELPAANIQPVEQTQHIITFSPEANTWSAGSTHTLDVVFNTMPSSTPTTVGFSLQYDPSVFELVDVTTGNLWTKSTFLEKNIDQGMARVTVAQSLDGKLSEAQSPSIAKLTLKVLPSISQENSVISFGSEGAFGSVDLDHLESVTGIPTRIVLQP